LPRKANLSLNFELQEVTMRDLDRMEHQDVAGGDSCSDAGAAAGAAVTSIIIVAGGGPFASDATIAAATAAGDAVNTAVTAVCRAQ
jgi:hypothetical protein